MEVSARCLVVESAGYQQHRSVITPNSSPSSGFAGLLDGVLGELQPLPGKRFVLSFTFFAPAVR
jgi:hypothetical protein